MKKNLSRTIRPTLTALAALFLAAVSAWAGPPLICHAFDIGDAKSLPWVSHDWNLSGAENYNTRNLPDDTIAILERGSRTTLAHMETLRRATLYARQDPNAARQLLLKLTARAEASASSEFTNDWRKAAASRGFATALLVGVPHVSDLRIRGPRAHLPCPSESLGLS